MSTRPSIRARRAAPSRRPRVPRADGHRRSAGRAPHEGLLPLDAPAIRLSEVARRLAISRASAYRLVQSGQLSGVRVGTTWRVLRVDFDAYLERLRAEAERRYRRIRA